MTNRPRIVFDTNVLVSAALFQQSVPRQAFDRAIAVGQILVSTTTFAEVRAVLSRPRFDRYVSAATRSTFLDDFQAAAQAVEITEAIRVCQDAKDDQFLELAVSGKARYLVTGDDDLLSLHPFREVLILTPVAFLQQL
jgi:uncharacterized protein